MMDADGLVCQTPRERLNRLVSKLNLTKISVHLEAAFGDSGFLIPRETLLKGPHGFAQFAVSLQHLDHQ